MSTDLKNNFAKKPSADLRKVISNKTITMVLILLVICIVSYLFYLNPNSSKVYINSTKSFELPLALIIIVAFLAGAAVVAGLAILIGIRQVFLSWRSEKEQHTYLQSLAKIVEAKELIFLNKFFQAEKLLSKTLAEAPKNILVLLNMSQVLQAQNKVEEAKLLLQKNVNQFKNNLLILQELSVIAERQKNLTASRDYYVQVLDKDPENISILRKLVDMEMALKNFENAKLYQAQVLKLCKRLEVDYEKHKLKQLEQLFENKDVKLLAHN